MEEQHSLRQWVHAEYAAFQLVPLLDLAGADSERITGGNRTNHACAPFRGAIHKLTNVHQSSIVHFTLSSPRSVRPF